MGTHWDTTELSALVRDLNGAGARMRLGAKRELKDGATWVHAQMKKDATGHRHLGKFARTVAKESIGDLAWEIGFNKTGQGNLANIIVFGSVNNAPVYDFAVPWRREIPILTDALADAAEDAVLGEGGHL